jgi:hypothetical protein
MIRTMALAVVATAAVAPFTVAAIRASGPERVDYHHQLKRALHESRCIPASAETVWSSGPATAFEVTCRGRPRKLVVACDARPCRAEEADEHDRGEDEP